MSKIKKEVARFLVVGCSAVATDTITYFLLINIWAHTPAKATSFIAGTFVAYIFNKYWTFEQKQKSYSEVLRFVVLYLSTLCANVGVNKAVLTMLPEWVVFAFLCATATSTVLNFIGQKWWVFKPVEVT